MAEAALINEQLGKHADTDMLTVSVSSTRCHRARIRDTWQENHDVYMQLDKDLTTFLNASTGKWEKATITVSHCRPRSSPQLQLNEKHRILRGMELQESHCRTEQVILKAVWHRTGDGRRQLPVYFNDSTIQAKGLEKKRLSVMPSNG